MYWTTSPSMKRWGCLKQQGIELQVLIWRGVGVLWSRVWKCKFWYEEVEASYWVRYWRLQVFVWRGGGVLNRWVLNYGSWYQGNEQQVLIWRAGGVLLRWVLNYKFWYEGVEVSLRATYGTTSPGMKKRRCFIEQDMKLQVLVWRAGDV